jgi:hypothetical protein
MGGMAVPHIFRTITGPSPIEVPASYLDVDYSSILDGTAGSFGTLSIAPTAGSLTQGLNISQSMAGTNGAVIDGGAAYNQIVITGDSVDASNGGNWGMVVDHTFGGSTVTGARSAFLGYLKQNAVTSPSNVGLTYSGATFASESSTGDGGTNTGAGSRGGYFGINPQVRSNGATNVNLLAGIESNIFGTAASTQKYVWAMSATSGHINAASTLDTAFVVYSNGSFSGYGPGGGFGNGLMFSELSNGLVPIRSTGTLIGTHLETLSSLPVTAGINLFNCTFSSFAIATPGFRVGPLGDSTIGGDASGAGSRDYWSFAGNNGGFPSMGVAGLDANISPVYYTAGSGSHIFVVNGVSGTTILTLAATGVTSTTRIVAPASTASLASIALPHGSAPSSPNNGDMWTTTAGLFVRINGSTVGPLS